MNNKSPKYTMALLVIYVILLVVGFAAPAMHYSMSILPKSEPTDAGADTINFHWHDIVLTQFFLLPLFVLIVRAASIYWLYQSYQVSITIHHSMSYYVVSMMIFSCYLFQISLSQSITHYTN